MRIILVLFLLLFAIQARAGQVLLEAGAQVEGNLGTMGTENQNFSLGIGFSVRASYETRRWGFGIMTKGGILDTTPIIIKADGGILYDDLTLREIALGPVIRYYFGEKAGQKRGYMEAGALAAQNDVINPEASFPLPPDARDEAIFINGYAITAGAGIRFPNSHVFLQMNYYYQNFDLLQVVGRIREKKSVIHEYPLQGRHHSLVMSFSFGIAEVL